MHKRESNDMKEYRKTVEFLLGALGGKMGNGNETFEIFDPKEGDNRTTTEYNETLDDIERYKKDRQYLELAEILYNAKLPDLENVKRHLLKMNDPAIVAAERMIEEEAKKCVKTYISAYVTGQSNEAIVFAEEVATKYNLEKELTDIDEAKMKIRY